MDLKRSIEIIAALADGHNPYTGELFDGHSIYQHPDTIRALYAALEAMKAKLRNQERVRRLPENAGKPWSEEEDTEVLREYDQKMNIREIAERHHRTITAIRDRLIKQGKVLI